MFIKSRAEEEVKADNERRRRYKGAAQKAVDKLLELLDSYDEKIALAACKEILDRAGDKPSDKLSLSGSVETNSSFFDALNGKAAGAWNNGDTEAE